MRKNIEHETDTDMALLPKYVTRQFGAPSGVGGMLVGWIMAAKNKERSRKVVEVLRIKPDDTVLEIGSGPGIALAEVSVLLDRGIAIGVDLSEVMVRQSKARLREAIDQAHVDVIHASVASLPFPEGFFDKAFSINSIMFWPDPVASMSEVRRTLKPGGMFVLAVQPHWAETEAQFATILATLEARTHEAGFSGVTTLRLETGKAPVLCILAQNPERR